MPERPDRPLPRPARARVLRRAAVGLTVLGVTVAAAGLAPTAGATTDAPATRSVTYTSKTVVVTTSTLKKELLSVSNSGATYTFRKKTGSIAKLKTGKVMLLQRLAARVVTKTATKKHHFVVTTKPAAITDLVKNGTLALDAPIDFSKGFVVSGAAVPPERVRAGAANQRSLAAMFGMRPLTRAGVKVSGKVDGYGWSAVFTSEKSAVGVAITITRSSPIKLEATISGTLKNLRTASNISVNSGKLTKAKLLANSISGDFKLSYSAQPISAFGLGQAGGIKIDLPAEIMVPFFIGTVPFFVGVRVSFFASAGFSGYDQKLAGSWGVTYDGSGGISTTSSGATSPAGVLKGLADIVLNAANAVKNGPLSFIFGAQMPQIELGLGVKGFNVAGNVTLIGSSGIATYASGCDVRQMEFQADAGANASFFGLSASLGSAQLFDKTVQAAYPAGCGTFPN